MPNESVVWKYPLPGPDIMHDIPAGAMIRTVGVDPATGAPAVWCEVDPHADPVRRRFLVRGTGQPLDVAQAYEDRIERTIEWLAHYDDGPTGAVAERATRLLRGEA